MNAIRSLNLLNFHPSKLVMLFQYNFFVLFIKGTKFCVVSNWTTFTPFNYHFPQSPGLCQVKPGFIHIKTICYHVANLRNLKICVGKLWFMQ